MRVAASVTRFGRIRTAQASAIPAPTAVATVPPSTHHRQSAHAAAPGASDIDVVRLVRNVGLVAVSQAAASATYGDVSLEAKPYVASRNAAPRSGTTQKIAHGPATRDAAAIKRGNPGEYVGTIVPRPGGGCSGGVANVDRKSVV